MKPRVSVHIQSGQLFEIKYDLPMSWNAVKETVQQYAPWRMPLDRKWSNIFNNFAYYIYSGDRLTF